MENVQPPNQKSRLYAFGEFFIIPFSQFPGALAEVAFGVFETLGLKEQSKIHRGGKIEKEDSITKIEEGLQATFIFGSMVAVESYVLYQVIQFAKGYFSRP